LRMQGVRDAMAPHPFGSMASAGGGRRRGRRLIQRGHKFGAHHLGNGGRAAHVADRVLDDIVRWFLAVVDLLTIQVDLKPPLPNGCQRDADLTVASSANLSCHTGSLPEVPSRNAVLNL